MIGKKTFTMGFDNAPHFVSKEVLFATTLGFTAKFRNVIARWCPFAKQHGEQTQNSKIEYRKIHTKHPPPIKAQI